jgi:hypothetical protein
VQAQIHCPREDYCKATLIYFQITWPGSSTVHFRTNGGGYVENLTFILQVTTITNTVLQRYHATLEAVNQVSKQLATGEFIFPKYASEKKLAVH